MGISLGTEQVDTKLKKIIDLQDQMKFRTEQRITDTKTIISKLHTLTESVDELTENVNERNMRISLYKQKCEDLEKECTKMRDKLKRIDSIA